MTKTSEISLDKPAPAAPPSGDLPVRTRLIAIGGVLAVFGLVGLYTREYAVFTNTIGVEYLVAGALTVGAAVAGWIFYRFRDRFTPWGRHIPEILTISLGCLLFAPLFASLLNRGLGRHENQSFEFLDETPFVSTGGYGLLRTQQIKISGFQLQVRENGMLYRFRYRKQPYFPITKPGEAVLLPMRKGLFGCRVLELE